MSNRHKLYRLIDYIALEVGSADQAYSVMEGLIDLSHEDWKRFVSDASTRYRKREHSRVYRANKRARDLGLPGTLTSKEWFITLDYFDRRCAYCRELFSYEHIEHWVPISSEDTQVGTTVKNCVPACHQCNAKKGAKEDSYWQRLLMNRDLWGRQDEFALSVIKVGKYLQDRKEIPEEKFVEKTLFDEK